MLSDLDAAGEIGKQADKLLRIADAYDRLPTPVEDIVAAAGLSVADAYVFDDDALAAAPPDIRHLILKARDNVRGILDRRERIVHVSPTIEYDGKRRFVLMHETSHGMLPHQQHLVFADDDERLSAGTRRLFEREANHGAAELLFQRDRFALDAADLDVSISAVHCLAKRYGASFHASFRRYAETHFQSVAAVVLSPDPFIEDPPTWRREEVLASPSWKTRIGAPLWPRTMRLRDQPWLATLNRPGPRRVEFSTLTGESVFVRVEAKRTTYNNFVLLSATGHSARSGRPARASEAALALF